MSLRTRILKQRAIEFLDWKSRTDNEEFVTQERMSNMMSKNISKICINNDNHLTYLYTSIFWKGIPFVFCDQWLTYAQIFLFFCNHNFGHWSRSLQATEVFSQILCSEHIFLWKLYLTSLLIEITD